MKCQNLHSSMDRFEVHMHIKYHCRDRHLHSSMDRFEVAKYICICSFYRIYIPVWIDLKFSLCFAALDNPVNLHSSMDRFEGIGKTARCLSCFGQCVLSTCLVICIYFFYLFINFFKTAYCSDFSPLSTYGVFCFIWG